MTSVANICRTCGFSNGTFYRYYQSKEQIFQEIVQDIKSDFENVLDSINGGQKFERLAGLYRSVFDILWNSKRKFMAFHEAEYRFPEIESSVDATYQAALVKALRLEGDTLSLPLKWFLVGSTRFTAIYWIIFHRVRVPDSTIESLAQFTLEGFINEGRLDAVALEFDLGGEKLTGEAKARESILRSAEKLIGEKGYFKTSIYDIMSLAGYGQGTFYLYFQSKEKLLEELVLQANRNLRSALKAASAKAEDRLNKEMKSYKAFLLFMKIHKELYNIVRESEFIFPETGKLYYEKLLASYMNALNQSRDRGEIRALDTRDLGVFLMGIGHFMGLDLLFVHKKKPESWNGYLEELAVLIKSGCGGALT